MEKDGQTPMRFGVVVPTFGDHWGRPEHVRQAVIAAEQHGFETVWFGDHIITPESVSEFTHPNWFDSLVCCMAGAGVTDRIRFSPDVLVLPYRNPVELAQTVATIDQFSGGRVSLAVGVGYLSGEFEAVGAPSYHRRGAVTSEYIEVLRTLWNGTGPQSFSGEFVQFEGVESGPQPVQDRLPILVGGNAKAAMRRAALLGDGWHPLFPTPEAYAEGRRLVLQLREHAGQGEPFRFSLSCPPCSLQLSSDSTPKSGDRPSRQDRPSDYDYAPHLPVAPGGSRRYFNGTPSEVIRDIEVYGAAGVEQLALRLATPAGGELTIDGWLEQLGSFASLVMPAFSDR